MSAQVLGNPLHPPLVLPMTPLLTEVLPPRPYCLRRPGGDDVEPLWITLVFWL